LNAALNKRVKRRTAKSKSDYSGYN